MLAPGERTKSFPVLARLCERLLEMGLERGGLVVALGGGVIGDLTGLAASLVRRGVRFVQVPTTLLAQVDSSVGGKTGINTPQGKNLVGTFHQPSLVLADIGVLATLPPRELRAGYVEAAKYGLLGDAAFFAWLERNGQPCWRRSPTPSPMPSPPACRARPTSSPATRPRPATACCSTWAIPSATPWRPGPATPTGSCTARPWPSASASPSS